MAKKEYIGISSEYDRLRIARVRAHKDGIELLGVDTVDLPYPVVRSGDASDNPMEFTDDFEDLFGADSDTPSTTGFPGLEDVDESQESKGDDLEKSFDMTNIDDDSEIATENERLFSDYLSKLGQNKLRFGLHIPFGKTTFQFYKNVDPSSMNKKEQREFFIEKLRPIHDRDAEPDEYAWSSRPQDGCLLAYNYEDHSLVNLVELAETYFKGKLLINERVPDEGIWAGLARTNYDLKEDDITGLIAIGESTSRVIFMKGEHIINVLPIITEGESSDDILNTIFSKILFEIDKGELPKISRLLIARSVKLADRVKKYFQGQFDDVEVDYITLNPEKVTYSDDILDSPAYLQPYMSAIGAAWAASKVNEKEFSEFSIVPEYIRERQRVLKLEWHGIAILVLIALTPLFLNNLYNKKAEELRSLEQDMRMVELQIEELQPIATLTEDLMSDLTVINSENDRLLELAQYSQKWSQVFRIFNEGINDIPNVWLTTLRTDENNLSITGFSLGREQIPVVSQLYSNSNVQQVQETELRGQPIYSFSMQTNNYLQDLDEFIPEMPQSDFDPENDSDVPFSFSTDSNLQREIVFDSFTAYSNSNETADKEPETSQTIAEPQRISPTGTTYEREPNGAADQTPVSDVSEGDDDSTVQEVDSIGEATSGSVSNSTIAKSPSEPNSPYGLYGPENDIAVGSYTIVLHSIPDEERAIREKESLENENYKATLWQADIGNGQINWRIGVGQFETVGEALNALPDLPEPYRNDHFIIRIQNLEQN